MAYLCNAFSLQMLDTSVGHSISIDPIDSSRVPTDVTSAIGHQETADVVSNILGFEVPMNRTSITLVPGDVIYVAQLTGGRLPEGSTSLPDGFEIQFLVVSINS